MDINVQITHEDKNVTLPEAIEKGYIKIMGNAIVAQEGTILSLSSRLFDADGNELYENDIVQTDKGKQYKIIYDFGVFYLYGLENKEIMPLYVFKLKNTVDVQKVNI